MKNAVGLFTTNTFLVMVPAQPALPLLEATKITVWLPGVAKVWLAFWVLAVVLPKFQSQSVTGSVLEATTPKKLVGEFKQTESVKLKSITGLV